MRSTRFMFLITALLTLNIGSVSAQTDTNETKVKVPLTFSIGDFSKLGYKNPYLAFGGGVEVWNKHFLFRAGGDFSPSPKFVTSDGYSISFNGQGLYRHGFLSSDQNSFFYLGGGGRYGVTKTSEYSKGNVRPMATFGLEKNFPKEKYAIRGFFSRIFDGTDKINRLNGYTVKFEWDLRSHFRYSMEYGHYRFHQSFNPRDQRTAQTVHAAFSYIF